MKTARIIAIFCLALACCIMFQYAATESKELRTIKRNEDLNHKSGQLGNYRALVIGINDYKDPNIPKLKTAVNDAKAMAKLLEEKYGFSTELILDRNATRNAIYNTLRSFSSAAGEDDNLLIYYAGHGDYDREQNDGWWVPSDAEGGNPSTYLDNTAVQKAMGATKARHALLISDSCYSGTLFGQARAIPPVITEKYYLNLYNEKSRWGMTSGNKEPVSDAGTGGHSIFAYQLLKELRKNENPYISTQELYTRIAPIIGNNSEQTPLCRPIRNTGDQGGEFVFILADSGSIATEKPVTPAPVKPPKPKEATLSISADVSGAEVRINGTSYGALPGKFRLSGSGNYKIEITAPGYKTYRVSREIEPGKEYKVDARLEVEPVKAAGSQKPSKEDFTNSLGMKFVPIPADSFMMGSPKDEPGRSDNEVQHKVTISKPFFMQTTEVTQGQWKAVMGNNPSSFSSCGDDCPVEQVSWDDIQEFIKKLNRKGEGTYRLPTEAEWEYAARAGTTTPFASGKCLNPDQANYDGNYPLSGCPKGEYRQKTVRVGSFSPNAWGLYDMHGNVWEWCQDWYGNYPGQSVKDPTGPDSGSDRVIRGGGWSDTARDCRSASRDFNSPGDRLDTLGFRLLSEAP